MEGSKKLLVFETLSVISFLRFLLEEWRYEAALFFDFEERVARLSGLGDQLEAFSQTVNFEVFRPDLDKGSNC